MRVLVIAALLILPGCYSLANYRTAEKVAAATTVEHDEYEHTVWVKAPEVWYDESEWKGGKGDWDRAFMRTLISTRNGALSTTHQLYVIFYDLGWAFLERATDRQGRRLETTVISRDVRDYGTISEHVAVELPDEYLHQAAIDGLDIQVSGQRGRTVVKLPPHYVQGFLSKLESAAPVTVAAH